MSRWASALGGLAIAVVMAMPAAVRADSTPGPRAFNVTFDGFYLVTNNSTASQQTLKGVGIINSDPAGDLSGIENFTLVSPSLPPGSTTVCSGSAGGSITQQNDGTFIVALDYTPSSASAAAGCFQSSTTFVCTRHVARAKLESDLAAGRYNCIATGATTSTSNVTINAVSEVSHFGAHLVDNSNGD